MRVKWCSAVREGVLPPWMTTGMDPEGAAPRRMSRRKTNTARSPHLYVESEERKLTAAGGGGLPGLGLR